MSTFDAARGAAAADDAIKQVEEHADAAWIAAERGTVTTCDHPTPIDAVTLLVKVLHKHNRDIGFERIVFGIEPHSLVELTEADYIAHMAKGRA